jgi:transcriptional regulator of NAD metabolism
MTDVVKLVNSSILSTNNGYSIMSANVRGNSEKLAPKINSQTHVSGLAGAVDNGYLGNRFK